MSALQALAARARDDPDVAGVILFGSAARGEPHRDVDVALVQDPSSSLPAGALRDRYLADAPDELDVHVFGQLPLYVRRRVLNEGRVLVARDEDALYDVSFRTAREWEDYRPFYEAYLEDAGRA